MCFQCTHLLIVHIVICFECIDICFERQDARYVGVSPGERLKCAESGCFPGRDDCVQQMDIPRTKCIIVNVLLDDYCIRPALVTIRRRHSPHM